VAINFRCSRSSWRSNLITIWSKINQASQCLIIYWTLPLQRIKRQPQIQDQSIPATTVLHLHISISKWSRPWWSPLRTSIMNCHQTSKCRYNSSTNGHRAVNSQQQPQVTCPQVNTWFRMPSPNSSLCHLRIIPSTLRWWVRVTLRTGVEYLALRSSQWSAALDRIRYRHVPTQLLWGHLSPKDRALLRLETALLFQRLHLRRKALIRMQVSLVWRIVRAQTSERSRARAASLLSQTPSHTCTTWLAAITTRENHSSSATWTQSALYLPTIVAWSWVHLRTLKRSKWEPIRSMAVIRVLLYLKVSMKTHSNRW
jgi:hypothetical protein